MSDVKERDHPHYPLRLGDRLRNDDSVFSRRPQFEVVNFTGEGVLKRYTQLEEGNKGDSGFLVTVENEDHTLAPIGLGSIATRELFVKTGRISYECMGQFTLVSAVVLNADANFEPAMGALVKEAINSDRESVAAIEPIYTDGVVVDALVATVGDLKEVGKIGGPGIPKRPMQLFVA